ncbi:MAG TPA: hypothetical protein VF194_18185 [Ferrovibrio sp.]|uniref:hypothetical protein n=1 Tax=Ferrovibrio sp. TaxID=1917215 RepID=UPI002ED5C953
MDAAEITRNYLLYLIMPLWVAVGFADWLCHRAARIAATAGPKESVIHLLMLAEVGIGVLAGLFFEINPLVLIVMLMALILHEITAYWDVSYAYGRRAVTAIEQRVHDYLGAIPFMAFSFVVILHWPAAMRLVQGQFIAGDWSLAWKGQALPIAYIVALLAAIALFDALPFGEELLRGLSARAAAMRRKAGAD